MRASQRCAEHFQGDRCKKERTHDFATHPEQDLLHAGNFTAWTGSGDRKTVKGKTKGAVLFAKRNRSLNRFMRRIKTGKHFDPNLVPHAERKPMKYFLQMAVKYFRGIQL